MDFGNQKHNRFIPQVGDLLLGKPIYTGGLRKTDRYDFSQQIQKIVSQNDYQTLVNTVRDLIISIFLNLSEVQKISGKEYTIQDALTGISYIISQILSQKEVPLDFTQSNGKREQLTINQCFRDSGIFVGDYEDIDLESEMIEDRIKNFGVLQEGLSLVRAMLISQKQYSPSSFLMFLGNRGFTESWFFEKDTNTGVSHIEIILMRLCDGMRRDILSYIATAGIKKTDILQKIQDKRWELMHTSVSQKESLRRVIGDLENHLFSLDMREDNFQTHKESFFSVIKTFLDMGRDIGVPDFSDYFYGYIRTIFTRQPGEYGQAEKEFENILRDFECFENQTDTKLPTVLGPRKPTLVVDNTKVG